MNYGHQPGNPPLGFLTTPVPHSLAAGLLHGKFTSPVEFPLALSEPDRLRNELSAIHRRDPRLNEHADFYRGNLELTLEMLDGQSRSHCGSHAASHSQNVFQKLVDHGYRDPGLLGAAQTHDDPEDYIKGVRAGLKKMSDSGLYGEEPYRDSLVLVAKATRKALRKPSKVSTEEWALKKAMYYLDEYGKRFFEDGDPRLRLLKLADIYDNAPTAKSLEKCIQYLCLILKFEDMARRDPQALASEGRDGMAFLKLAQQAIEDRLEYFASASIRNKEPSPFMEFVGGWLARNSLPCPMSLRTHFEGLNQT